MQNPRISLGLPVYNGEKYLRFALDSIMQQDYTDFELIISDNASNDATQEICRSAAANDRRIRYYRNETNIGACPNFNRVFELAHGEYFKWVAHDDEFYPSLLRRCFETFTRSAENVVVVCARSEIINESGRVLFDSGSGVGSSHPRPSVRLTRFFLFHAGAHPFWGLIRSDALRQTRMMRSLEEADLVLLSELVLLGNIVEIPDVLYRMRYHSGQAVAINRTRRQLLIWTDARRVKDGLVLPRWLHRNIEFFKSIYYIPLPRLERLRCCVVAVAVPFWRWILNQTGPLRQRLGLVKVSRMFGKSL